MVCQVATNAALETATQHATRWRTELQIATWNATWNVRGGMEEKMNELLDVMDDRDLDVDTGGRSRKKHEDPPKGVYEEVDDSGRGERGM